ncbi:LysM peptidoglycan-binding domain-containing protein [Streptomyces albus]|uniref:LysM peptidoglycan-binding domain-containing protein n=1 Tax=Streptomyces TaxID=1883 RepID=UPI001CEDFFF0|nr:MULTISPECIES: LysM peptidoglycan-binding domain-containing protein [Streptomyces]MDI6407790.1 LysM peptidoglycan-binding domain-containing protein [Streptomyces albus]
MFRDLHGRVRNTFQSHSRRVSRISLVIAAGGAGIAAPLLTAGSASAAPAPAHVQAHAPAAQQVKSEQESGASSYTVEAGDTLYRIAVDHDVEGGWKGVYDANRQTVGGNPNLIHPGQRLTLPTADDADKSADDSADKGAAEGGEAESAPRTTAQQSGVVHPTRSDNLDGWINEALAVMKQHGIPGSYEGIHRNIIRESAGNPNAINNWDINAQNGTPSIGLLQVIQPTFDAYHVQGTAQDLRDPVANIVAACNYAADRYGSIDNVNGPY